MFYPHRKIFTIPLTLKKKWRKNQTIFLKIPQATIRERSELSMMKDDEKIKFFIQKLSDWGAWNDAFLIYKSLGKNFLEIIKPYFFFSYTIEKIPESVLNLGKEEKYKFDTPTSTIFATVSQEYWIEPQELLNYTMDELEFLLNALHYKNLNDEQKAELQRLQNIGQISDIKNSLDEQLTSLDNF